MRALSSSVKETSFSQEIPQDFVVFLKIFEDQNQSQSCKALSSLIEKAIAPVNSIAFWEESLENNSGFFENNLHIFILNRNSLLS
jgi:hypothetical protein